MSTNSSFDITLNSELFLQSIDQLSFVQYCLIATGSVSINSSNFTLYKEINRDGQAWIWESLNSIDEDIALFQRFPTSLTHVIYIFSK